MAREGPEVNPVCAVADGAVALAAAEGLHGDVGRGEAGGAGSVNGEGRYVQVKERRVCSRLLKGSTRTCLRAGAGPAAVGQSSLELGVVGAPAGGTRRPDENLQPDMVEALAARGAHRVEHCCLQELTPTRV